LKVLLRARSDSKKTKARIEVRSEPLRTSSDYFWYTKWPRRFCCQQASLDSVQNGFSLP
jgi:hypothetical protein